MKNKEEIKKMLKELIETESLELDYETNVYRHDDEDDDFYFVKVKEVDRIVLKYDGEVIDYIDRTEDIEGELSR